MYDSKCYLQPQRVNNTFQTTIVRTVFALCQQPVMVNALHCILHYYR